MIRFTYLYVLFFSLNVSFGETCKEVFKTNNDFKDKKYSLQYLQTMDKHGSLKNILNQYPTLSNKETEQFLNTYQKKQDKRSYYILYFSNLKIAYKVAWEYVQFYNQHEKFDDYLQENLKTLVISLDNYDSSRGPFYPYVKKYMEFNLLRYRSYDTLFKKYNNSKLSRLLSVEKKKNPHTFGTNSWWGQFNKKYPKYSFEQINHIMLSLSMKNVTETKLKNVVLSKDSHVNFLENIPDVKAGNVQNRITDRMDIEKIYNWTLEKFSKKKNNQKVWIAVINDIIFSENPKKDVEIGRKFGLSGERIRQIKNKVREIIKSEFSYY